MSPQPVIEGKDSHQSGLSEYKYPILPRLSGSSIQEPQPQQQPQQHQSKITQQLQLTMDRIMFGYKPPYAYPLLNPDGTYKNATLYPNAPSYEHQLALAHANAAEQARRTATTAAYNYYTAQVAAGRA